MGWPISHSRSPRLHNHWLKRYKIKGDYIALPVQIGTMKEALIGLRALGFQGANVTLPHKQAALHYADCSTDAAQRIGAANMVTCLPDGRIEADNSDGLGFIYHLRESIPDWQPNSGLTLVFGAGGAARAVLFALFSAGVEKIHLINRTKERAEALADSFGRDKFVIGDFSFFKNWFAETNLLVNTTSLGMEGQPDLPVDCALLPTKAIVYDLVYTPLRTSLIQAAQLYGLRSVDGLGMLLHQAAPGFARWFGREAEIDPALREAVASDLLV